MRSGAWVALTAGVALLAVLASEALAQPHPLVAAAATEPRREAIERQIDRLERRFRRLREGAAGSETWKAEAARSGLERLRSLESRLETWLGKRHLEPHRRNLERFLRDLEVRLARLEGRLAAAERGDAGPPARGSGAARKRAEPATRRQPGGAGVDAGAPPNDECAGARPIGDGTFSGSMDGAGSDGESTCGATPPGPDIWFRYRAHADGEVVFNTFGSSFDTVLSLHSGCPGIPPNQLDCNDDALGVQSEVTRAVDRGAEVLVRVGGHGGTVVLNVGRPAEISGVVRDSVTGQGIEGARVFVYDDNDEVAGFATTSPAGGYRVGGLRAQTFHVKVSHPDYFSQLFDGIPCSPYCDPSTGTPIELGLGETASADLDLVRGALVEGRVTDESGAAIPDVRVAVYGDDGRWQDSDQTGPAGEYSISALLAGTYFAKADDAGGYLGELFDDVDCPPPCDPVVGTPIVLAEDATARADFALRLGGGIAGRVVDALTGQPLQLAYVRIRDGGGRLVAGVETDSAGYYIADGLRDGSHFAVAEAYEYLDQLYDGLDCPPYCDPTTGTPIAVTPSDTTTGIDFALVPSSALSGRLLDAADGTPVSPAWVDAWNDLGEWAGSDSADAAGIYTVESLPAGTYFASTDNLAGYLDELYDDLPCSHGRCDVVAGTPIVVPTAATTSGIDFALRLGGSISGAVSDAGGAVGLRGQVLVWDSSGAELDSVSIDDGAYRVPGLPDGDHFVATAVWQQYHDELYDDLMCLPSCEDPAGGTPVSVTAGAETGGIDFELCGPPKLQVRFPPHSDPDSFIDGCSVQIDALATRYHPGCPPVALWHWQWGDGSAEVGFPPRAHTYDPGDEWRVVSVAAYDGLGLYSSARESIRLWDCLPPAACGQPQERLLDDLVLEGQHVVQACTTITLGPALDILPPADVTFLAGESIGLLDGVRILGDRVVIDDDPALLP